MPTSASVHSDTIVLNYSNGASSQTAERALTGTGLNPATLTVSDGMLRWSKVLQTETDETFTITNSGDVSATTTTGWFIPPFSFKGGLT